MAVNRKGRKRAIQRSLDEFLMIDRVKQNNNELRVNNSLEGQVPLEQDRTVNDTIATITEKKINANVESQYLADKDAKKNGSKSSSDMKENCSAERQIDVQESKSHIKEGGRMKTGIGRRPRTENEISCASQVCPILERTPPEEDLRIILDMLGIYRQHRMNAGFDQILRELGESLVKSVYFHEGIVGTIQKRFVCYCCGYTTESELALARHLEMKRCRRLKK